MTEDGELVQIVVNYYRWWLIASDDGELRQMMVNYNRWWWIVEDMSVLYRLSLNYILINEDFKKKVKKIEWFTKKLIDGWDQIKIFI